MKDHIASILLRSKRRHYNHPNCWQTSTIQQRTTSQKPGVLGYTVVKFGPSSHNHLCQPPHFQKQWHTYTHGIPNTLDLMMLYMVYIYIYIFDNLLWSISN
jgi:hypothetical protein